MARRGWSLGSKDSGVICVLTHQNIELNKEQKNTKKQWSQLQKIQKKYHEPFRSKTGFFQ